MLLALIRRFGQMIFVMFGISILVFLIFFATPGADPASRIAGRNASPETIEAVRLIKEEIAHVKTVLGISNVSFGLPDAGREVLNSVFLYHCTKAGLDLAIVNSEKLERYASIPEDERRLARPHSAAGRVRGPCRCPPIRTAHDDPHHVGVGRGRPGLAC